jgi:tetratricopeptide (TPR) repeat protein
VGFSEAVATDVRIFETAVQAESITLDNLENALTLYRGEFLEGFSLPDSVQFDDWLIYQRTFYARLAVRGFQQLSGRLEEQGQYAAAIDPIIRALSLGPFQEDLQRTYLRLLYLSGDRPAAIRQYDVFRRALDEEMGVPPMVETRALYDAILNDTLEPSASRKPQAGRAGVRRAFRSERVPHPSKGTSESFESSIPFTGRSEEIQLLQALPWGGRLALIEGEAGIGKTRLAGEFIRTGGYLAARGAARELEQAIPYQPWVEAFRNLQANREWPELLPVIKAGLPPVWLREAARLVPELLPDLPGRPEGDGQHEESRLREGIHQFLMILSRQRKVVIFLDDLHWADASTLSLLGYLCRQEDGGNIFFLATTRNVPPRSPLAALLHSLIREDRLIRIPLSRLEPEQVAEIARSISPQFTYPLAEWLVRNSEGIPYMLTELIEYARSNKLLLHEDSSGEWVVNLSAIGESPAVPQSVYSLVQSRVNQLSDEALRILGAAAATGREFPADVVTRAAGLSEEEALDALDELARVGLIHPLDGMQYAFDHSLTMEVARTEGGEPRHRSFHRRIAEAMEQLYPRSRLSEMAGIIATHYAEGHDPRRAAPYAMRAGQQASSLAAWGEAISFFEAAARGYEELEALPALMELGKAQQNAGQSVKASDTFRQVLALARSGGKRDYENEARLALASSLVSQGRYGEVIEIVRQVCSEGDPRYAIQAEFLWGTALSLEGSDLDEAARHLHNAEELCQDQPGGAESPEMARIQFELGSIHAQRGDFPGAIRYYQRSLQIGCNVVDESALIWCVLAYNNLAYHLHLMDDPAAMEYAKNGYDLAQEKGLLGVLPYLYSTMGEIKLAEGDLKEAEKDFQHGFLLAEQLGNSERMAGLTANQGRLAKAKGETSLAIHLLSTSLAQAEAIQALHLSAQIRLWLAPMLPEHQRKAALNRVRQFADEGKRKFLRKQLEDIETNPK